MPDEAALIAILRRLVDGVRSGEPEGKPWEGEPWRSYHLACLIRDAGQGAMFTEFVDQSMAAWDTYWQARPAYSPEETARRAADAERLGEIDQLAKQQFLAGQQAAAEETYLKGAELRRRYDEYASQHARGHFADWLVEAGRFAEAVALVQAA